MKFWIPFTFAIALVLSPGGKAQEPRRHASDPSKESRRDLDCTRTSEIELWRAWPSVAPTGFLDPDGSPLLLERRLDAAPAVVGVAVREVWMYIGPSAKDPAAHVQTREEVELRLSLEGQRILHEEARQKETGLWEASLVAFRVGGETLSAGIPMLRDRMATVAAPLSRRFVSLDAAANHVRELLGCK